MCVLYRERIGNRPGRQGRLKMEKARAEAVIEAVLFTMGESVEISRLADEIGAVIRRKLG